ncbi:hypothetical protein CTEN210_18469 [Chaetoceros tenuissimus]|uniref:Helicase-associated domain-containing protein n=1 Tax=Chaetoceros tenuissimus TaxID=426638 RepID=A0AAD3DCQ4_9STRA|nr:hypothetical protein CTEN210_18469 [Chaetoceros tenuissimus]
MNYTWKTVYGDQRLVDLARQLRGESSDSEEEEVNDDDSDEYDSDDYEFVNEEDEDDNDNEEEEEDASSSEEEEVKESKYDKRLIKIWNKRFEQLKKYKAKHGHCNVPKQYHANKTLAVWVYTQRQQYKKLLEGLKTCMTNERVRILEGIGFEWAPMKDTWNHRFEELKNFKARYGHCNVPHKYEPNKTLAGWVHHQRYQFQLMSKGSNTQITEDRIKQLNDIDFEWAPKKDAWYDMFEELEKYKEQNGHCNVPYNYIANKALGGWVHTQRDQFQLMSKGSNAKITEERVKLLDNIGFEWTPMKSAWNEKFEELKKYKAQNGHCNVPKQHHANKSLAHWVQSQRRQYKAMMDGSKSQIVEERIKKLESIGFEWTPMKDAWNDRFEELKIFKARYGHCNVPRVYEPNKTLGGWVNKQRRQYNNKKIFTDINHYAIEHQHHYIGP